MNLLHIDLNIVDGDFVLNNSLSPEQINSEHVISQDIKHRILESGLLTKLIGQRNKNGITPVLIELELEIELDERLIPGSIQIVSNLDKTITITANTKQYGNQAFNIEQAES